MESIQFSPPKGICVFATCQPCRKRKGGERASFKGSARSPLANVRGILIISQLLRQCKFHGFLSNEGFELPIARIGEFHELFVPFMFQNPRRLCLARRRSR